MLTAKEIKDKAEKSYKDFLISTLRREVFFPYHIKGNKGNANLPLQELYPALKHLMENAKDKLGYGYTLTFKEINTRHSGIISLPDAIFFENPQDYLKFVEKENDFLAFRKAVDLTKKQVPALLPWVENNVLKCQKYALEWADFLKIIIFFAKNRPQGYWRQLLVEVDLPAFEPHQPIIADLLEEILPPAAIRQAETRFEARFGLRYDEPMLRFRFLDNTFSSEFGDDIALPLSKLAHFEASACEKIFFITDKNTFLCFPELPNSIAFFWEHSPDLAAKVAWFKQKIGYFVGDITPKSFEQLSEMRAILPQIISLLMDKSTFDAFPQHHESTKVSTNINPFLAHLTPEEQLFYQFLLNLKGKNGLLLKNVAYLFIEKMVKKL